MHCCWALAKRKDCIDSKVLPRARAAPKKAVLGQHVFYRLCIRRCYVPRLGYQIRILDLMESREKLLFRVWDLIEKPAETVVSCISVILVSA